MNGKRNFLTKKYDMIKNNIMKMGKTLSEGFALNPVSTTEITSNLSFIVIRDITDMISSCR